MAMEESLRVSLDVQWIWIAQVHCDNQVRVANGMLAELLSMVHKTNHN